MAFVKFSFDTLTVERYVIQFQRTIQFQVSLMHSKKLPSPNFLPFKLSAQNPDV